MPLHTAEPADTPCPSAPRAATPTPNISDRRVESRWSTQPSGSCAWSAHLSSATNCLQYRQRRHAWLQGDRHRFSRVASRCPVNSQYTADHAFDHGFRPHYGPGPIYRAALSTQVSHSVSSKRRWKHGGDGCRTIEICGEFDDVGVRAGSRQQPLQAHDGNAPEFEGLRCLSSCRRALDNYAGCSFAN
jgi:hypothetical protein